MGRVQIVGQVFFPLDEELGLLPGSLTPKHQDHLAHLGSWMPFAQAAQMLESLLGIQISEPTARRGTERTGARYEAHQTAESQLPVTSSPVRSVCEKQVISTDGAYVPLVGGEWAEVRTVVIGEVKTQSTKAPEEVHTRHLSYFSRMTDALTFADLAEVEMRRRGVSQANAVCAVTDGAPWIQGFIDLHRSDAVRILDFPHAAEHLGLLLEALASAGSRLPERALERCLHVLKHRGPALLWRWCERLPDAIKAQDAVQKQLDYFRKRLSVMQYPQYRRQGWPIGSGMVESANKVVVQARLKGAGMHWKPSHVNPMLALRTVVCNDRWSEAWQDQSAQHFRKQKQDRADRSAHRQEVAASRFAWACWFLLSARPKLLPLSPAPSPSSLASLPAATLPGSFRPSAHHPWKRGPSCRPKLSAKR